MRGFILFLLVCMCAHVHVKVKGQLCGVVSLLSPLCGFQGLNFSHQAYMVSVLSTEPGFYRSDLFYEYRTH